MIRALRDFDSRRHFCQKPKDFPGHCAVVTKNMAHRRPDVAIILESKMRSNFDLLVDELSRVDRSPGKPTKSARQTQPIQYRPPVTGAMLKSASVELEEMTKSLAVKSAKRRQIDEKETFLKSIGAVSEKLFARMAAGTLPVLAAARVMEKIADVERRGVAHFDGTK